MAPKSRPVSDLGPATLAIAWRAEDGRALVADFVTACRTEAKDDESTRGALDSKPT